MRGLMSGGEVLGGVRWDVVMGGLVLLIVVGVMLLAAVICAAKPRR
jgi:hypothetical protein